MRTKNILKHLILGATIFATGNVVGQATVPSNVAAASTDFLGWDVSGTNNFPLEIRHDGDFPIQFWTSGDFRGLINERVTYGSLNGFPNIPADGFNLITPNDGFLHQASKGPFSRLHLAEGGEDLNAQEWGYRPWQRNGITFTGNGDQGYIGHKYKDKDVTDMVIQWSDNPGTWKGDRMRFLFTSGYNPSATTGMNSAEGLEGMRLFPSEHDEIFVGVGDFYAGGDDPTERLDVRTGRVRIRKLPTDPEAATLDQYMVVDNTGVVKWRHLPSVSSCSSGWSLQGNNAVTAFNGNPCPPQDANYVGMGTPLSGFTLPVNSPPSFYTTKVNVLNNNFNTGMLSKTTRSTTGENFGVMTDVTGSSYLNAGLEVNIHGYSPYTRGIRVKTNGAYTSAYAGAFLAYDNADHTIGAEGISYGGTLESIGLWGETSGTAAKSYGVFGKATAPNSWAGWFEGNVMINGNGFLTGMIPITSDANLKTNVQALTNASEFLDQLLPKTYDFLVDEHPEIALPSGPQMGFIAQDVELILPQLVKQATIPATYDSTGAQLTASEDIKTLNYIGIIPLLVAGYQQQQATIAQLQDQINNCCSAQGGVAPQGGSEHRMVPQENDLHEQRLLIIPNPVADLTMLEYYVPKAGKVSLQVSTSDGKPLATLREELAEAGAYNYSWNTTKLAAGTYFCTFMLDGAVVVKRAVKVK